MTTVDDTHPADDRSIGSAVCAVAAAASFFASVATTVAGAPAMQTLPWLAAVAFGLAAPIALGGVVLNLALVRASTGPGSDRRRHIVLMIVDALALLGSAGLLLGAACLMADRLGTAPPRVPLWPFGVHGAVFVLLAISVLAHRFAGDDDVDVDDENESAHRSSVQLVTDNTRPMRLRQRARASIKNGIRINTDADFEMRDWSRKYDCTPEQLKAAVKAVGTMAADVEAYLATRH